MQKVFDEVTTLDKRAVIKYNLSEEILMENAAFGMYGFIKNNFKSNQSVLVVCGAGNNGADGLVLARLLNESFKVKIYLADDVKTNISKVQLQRVHNLGIKITTKIQKVNIVVDCLFGSGLNRKLSSKYVKVINEMNKIKAFKLACDIPSGINQNGQVENVCFKADTTITMGALKTALFADNVKDFVGDIRVVNLGLSKNKYERKSNIFLLDKSDLKLPVRTKNTTHKGTFGHLCVMIGEKKGAGLLACEAGFSFGCGLITAISSNEIQKISNDIMQSDKLPLNTTAICIGMGLGKKFDLKLLDNEVPKVLDADMFYNTEILEFLNKDNIVLTPHPKEFCNLLKISNIADVSIKTLQNNRFKYIKLFSNKYPKCTILLKGANVLIAHNNKIYINTFGSAILSKGGSGDVLSGLIGSLLAQGYTALEATISGSLAHTIASMKYEKNNYSLTPTQLIEQIKKL